VERGHGAAFSRTIILLRSLRSHVYILHFTWRSGFAESSSATKTGGRGSVMGYDIASTVTKPHTTVYLINHELYRTTFASAPLSM
jgi:hypothetical protein